MKSNLLVTVALLAYNQEKFIFEAVSSILSQNYYPLQIIISDDCSTDDTYSIASKLVKEYNGSHQIVLNRNNKNMGIGNHVNRIMELAEGELIVGAAGDDISFPDRVTEIVDMWLVTGKKYRSICSDMLIINEAGNEIAKLPAIEPVIFDRVLYPVSRWMNGAAHSWHKSLFEIFGPLRGDVVSEDKVIGFRSLLTGQRIGYLDKPLVKYRSHSATVTSGSTNLATLQQKISTYRSYIEDFNKARSLGYLKDRDDLDKVYREFVQIHSDFTLRHKILASGLMKAIILLISCGNKLSIQQKKNLFFKKLKGQEKKIGW